jgi:hypothetical protein
VKDDPIGRGAKIALAILLLWLGGLLLFVSFMSGKAASLTIGTDQAGNPQGPRNARELFGRLASNVQAAQGGAAQGEPEGGTS